MNDITKQLIIPQITGYGLKSFEDNAGYFAQKRQNDLNKMELLDASVNSLSNIASGYIQEKTYKKLYDAQMSQLSWVEKNIHLNSAKEIELRQERNKKAEQNALIVELGILAGAFILKHGISYVADKRRKTKFAETVYQILSYAAATNNQVPEYDDTIIRSVMLSMCKSGIISDKKRKKIPLNPIPTSIIEIDDCDSLRAFKEFIGSNIYKIFQNKEYSNEFILKEKRAIFEVIGFESYKELKDFIYSSHESYSILQNQHFSFEGIMLSMVENIGISFNKSKENRFQTSLLLNAYDPFKETRERNMLLIKQGVQIVGEIAIGTSQGVHPAVVTAYTLSKHLFVDKKDKNATEILQTSYEKSLVKNGLSKNEALSFIDEGEKLYKSVQS